MSAPASSADAAFSLTTSANLQPGNDPLLCPYGVTVPPPGVATGPDPNETGWKETSTSGTATPSSTRSTT